MAGRSFVTTGPSLVFAVGEALPGDVIDDGKQAFTLTIASTVDLDVVEIMVNGDAVQTLQGLNAGETKVYEGSVNLPAGGWIAARTFASEQQTDSWPTMHARPFAHSSPIWINKVGSTSPIAEKAAISDLLKAIDAAEKTAKEAYKDQDMPKLYARFEKARKKLRNKL
ncbi:MAG: TolB protein [Alphaproteobacteria bacterium]|jgi:TolB protein